jgi:hypothetical protein
VLQVVGHKPWDVGRGSPAWSVLCNGPPIEALVGFFFFFFLISRYEMETVGLKICVVVFKICWCG